MKKALLFLAVVLMGLSAMAQTTYTKVTSMSELNAGDKVLLVGYYEGAAYAMSYQKTNNRHAVEVSESGDQITAVVATDPSNETDPYEITIGKDGANWTFFDEVKGGYLYAAGGGNYLKTQTDLDDKGQWTIDAQEDGFVPTSLGAVEQNIMRFNINNSGTGTPLFGCYKPSSSVNGLVYIYKAGGAPVIYPEPSEYPSTFYSTVEGTSVILDWTDAGGAQLPQKYLVLASKGNITVPTDGTPVENGPLAKNVNYGVEMVTFDNLEGGKTYHFAIFPYTNSGANIDYKTNGNYPTATAITEDVTALLSENFANELGVFTAYSVTGEQVWHQAAYQGKTYANMNGYASNAAHENEDWLISPNILNGEAYDMITISFDNAFKFDGNALQVLYTEDTYTGGDPNGYGWIDITDNFAWSEGNYAWVETSYTLVDMDDVHDFTLAFKYTSTDAQASSWEITNIEIMGTGYAAVAENKAVSFNVYPNPATDNVKVNAESVCELQILDMAGRMVKSVNVVEGENTISVEDLNSGVYFVKMNGAVVKFVKR